MIARPGPRNAYDSIEPLIPGARPPDPLPELTGEEAAEWVKIVQGLPSGWISGENAVMLVELCRHVVYSRRIAADIEVMQTAMRRDASLNPMSQAMIELRKQWRDLLRAHGEQSQAIGNLSTKLRLSPQSRATAFQARTRAARAGSSARKPWEIDDDVGDRRQ